MLNFIKKSQGLLGGFSASAAKRCCGTCEYYDASTLEGNGWCRNPSRVGRDHMVLVRDYELACQNAWEQDEWQSKVSGGRVSKSEPAASERIDKLPAPSLARQVTERLPVVESSVLERQAERVQEEVKVVPAHPESTISTGTVKVTGLIQKTSLAYYMADSEDVIVGVTDRNQPPPPMPNHDQRGDPEDDNSSQTDFLDMLQEEWTAMQMAKYDGKRCATCRHYDKAGSPGVGWCRNRFSVAYQKMVQDHTLACISSIGIWWSQRPEDFRTVIREKLRRQ